MTRTPLTLALVVLATTISLAGDVNLPPLDTPYDQCTYLSTHNSYANPGEGFLAARSNQPDSITDQLNYGVRVINLDTWLIRQKPNILGCWKWEVYTEDSTKPGFGFNAKDPLQVVVAHGLDVVGADLFHDPCDPWKSLRAVLNDIGAWMLAHPDEVVTIVYETKIDSTFEVEHIFPAINGSSISNMIFHPSRPNPGVPAPFGRNDPHGWLVEKYGYPTLRQLVQAGKRVVMFPPYLPRSSPANSWKLEVQTVYGHECLAPYNINQAWVQPRDESAAIIEFTRPLFSVVHVPDLPGGSVFDGVLGINDIGWLSLKWNDIHDLYRRIPTGVWFDYYERGNNRSEDPNDPPGPALFVNFLNAVWALQPPVTAVAQIVPAPTAHGWNKTDVQVALSGSGDTIRAITSRTWEGLSLPSPTTNAEDYTFQDEGVTALSFSAVGSLGKRSITRVLDISIDKTLPTIVGSLDRPPDQAGWYASNVTAHFECSDALSGISFCTPDTVLSMDGASQSVTGMAIDRADNQSTATISNINIDTMPPVILSAADPSVLWPANGKLVSVTISGAISDAGSGVDPAAVSFAVTDEYHRVEPSGPIALDAQGNFSFVLRLDAQRSGRDRNGRHYIVRLKASDRVGHTAETPLTILVPHDRRSR